MKKSTSEFSVRYYANGAKIYIFQTSLLYYWDLLNLLLTFLLSGQKMTIHQLNCADAHDLSPNHARIQKVLSEWGPIASTFVFSWWWEGGSKYHYKRAIIGPPAKCHLNDISLACRWWPNIECWLESSVIFKGSSPVLLRNLIFLWFFRGGPDPLCPLWVCACPLLFSFK